MSACAAWLIANQDCTVQDLHKQFKSMGLCPSTWPSYRYIWQPLHMLSPTCLLPCLLSPDDMLVLYTVFVSV